ACKSATKGSPRRIAFGALRRFSVVALRLCDFADLLPALERRLIAFPKAQDKASCRLKIAHCKVDGFEFRHRAFSVAPMSALGQKQTSAHVRVTSALPPKADIRQRRLCANSRHAPTSALSPGADTVARES